MPGVQAALCCGCALEQQVSLGLCPESGVLSSFAPLLESREGMEITPACGAQGLEQRDRKSVV